MPLPQPWGGGGGMKESCKFSIGQGLVMKFCSGQKKNCLARMVLVTENCQPLGRTTFTFR